MAKELKCPNCQTPCLSNGKRDYVCPACDGRFRFKDGEAKLAGVGEIENLRQEMGEIKVAVRELAAAQGHKLKGQRPGTPTPDASDSDDDF